MSAMLTNRIVLQRHSRQRRAEAQVRLLKFQDAQGEFKAEDLKLYVHEEPHRWGDFAVVAEFNADAFEPGYVVAQLCTAAYYS